MVRAGNWAMGAFDGQLVTWLMTSCLGHTYDRSIMVDGEEASLMVYDIWEQVGCRLGLRVGVGEVSWGRVLLGVRGSLQGHGDC